MFNSFIFAQLFNEFCARDLFDGKNPFANLSNNYVFLSVIVITIALQIFLVYVGGNFVKTSGLNAENFLICIGLGSVCLLFNLVQRHIPCVEDPNDFASNPTVEEVVAAKEAAKSAKKDEEEA
jgi:magnesium-transporting ATPase (P-type)